MGTEKNNNTHTHPHTHPHTHNPYLYKTPEYMSIEIPDPGTGIAISLGKRDMWPRVETMDKEMRSATSQTLTSLEYRLKASGRLCLSCRVHKHPI